MDRVEWSDGLSTGVDVIDNDHKKILFLINKISEAIESQQTLQVMSNVFDELEDYVKGHFVREEELMRNCHYKDLAEHIVKHQEFTKKIPEFKYKLLANNSRQLAEEISFFLINWLINHIVAEDQLYVQAVSEHGLATHLTQDKPSLFNRLASWFSCHLALSKRIFLTSLLPAVAVLFFSVLIICNSNRELDEIKIQIELFHLVNQAGDLIHSLQTERGLSVGMVSSNYNEFSESVMVQRQLSYQAVNKLNYQLDNLSQEFVDATSLGAYIAQIRLNLNQLSEQQQLIDARSSSIPEIKRYYTKIITHLLSLPDRAVKYQLNSEVKGRITALSTIMHLKEAIGMERALGTKAIEEGEISGENLHKIIHLIGEQSGFLRIFMHSANPLAVSLYQQFEGNEASTASQRIETIFFDAAAKGNISSMDSALWFDLLSKKMNELELLSDSLVKDFDDYADQKILELSWKLYSTSVLLLFLLLLSLLLYKLLRLSIARPIRQLTRALVHLSIGKRDIHFNEKLANDELGQIAAAYELCRLNLLRGDLEYFELQHKERESEYFKELASIDPMTGIYNRRIFNIQADIELKRSQRHENSLSILMLDIDFFKKINDTYGHANGDLVLKLFAETCVSQLRGSDIIARVGGEEFAVLLPETNQTQAMQFAERIRKAVKAMRITVNDKVICLTVSIGVAQWDNEIHVEFSELFQQADTALYTAKTSGRDCVCSNEQCV